jgi:hypothetical protein
MDQNVLGIAMLLEFFSYHDLVACEIKYISGHEIAATCMMRAEHTSLSVGMPRDCCIFADLLAITELLLVV